MRDSVGTGDQYAGKSSNNGLEALQQNPTFQGPVEPFDDHDHSTDHFALVYQDRDEQLAAAIPFIRQGLELGERCLYIADENSKEEIHEAMRAHGIDVDAALDSGDLSILSPADTYRREGEFDKEEMLAYWEDSLEQATDEGDYSGIRAAAEMTWALDSSTNSDQLVEYEAMLNSIYENEDYVVLCQYNRERFSAEVIYEVIRTHPLLINDNVLSHNVYYTPPEEFFGPEQPAREIDRMMGTLRERTEAKSELNKQKDHFKRIFKSTNDALLIVDPNTDEIVHVNPAAEEMLGYTYDELLTRGPSDLHPDELDRFRSFTNEVLENGTGWTDELTYHTKDRGRIPVEISASRMEYDDRTVMLAAVRDISERRAHEQAQQRLYEIAADTDRSFDEKLQAIFELGCERFDMELGGMARVDVEDDLFEVEATNGEHDNLSPGNQYPLSETYCRLVTEDGETATVTNPLGRGFEGKLCYDQFGVRTYLGTYLDIQGDDDRTVWFVSNEQRREEFSETERTFQHLIGQWVQFELERRQREREIREQSEHLKAIIETSPDCIKTVAEDGTLLQINSAGVEIGGVDSASDVVGECVYDLVAPEHRDRYREFNERICEGESGMLEFDIIGLDGTRRRLESHAAPLNRPDGTTVQVAVSRDITEQLERKQELERALDLLNKTERIADVAGWEVDPVTKEPFWSDHLFNLLDVDYDEQPTLEEALDVYHTAEDRAIVEEAVENALETGEPFDVEVRFPRPKGDIGWLHVQGLPEVENEKVVSLRGAVQDITERKRREHQLEEVIERLEASNDRLKQFAYAASHDLQEPLRMVSSYLQLLEKNHAGDLDDQALEYIDFAVEGADRMREMVDDLLAYSRVEQSDETFESVDCEETIDKVTTDLEATIEETGAEIITDSLPTVTADAEQLEHLFNNLLSNALKYNDSNPPRVEITATVHSDHWEFSITDNGIGIDPAKTDQIFEIFKRLHHGNEYPGTGIGLSLCQEIVTNHGGEIWVESEPREGSTFYVTLSKEQRES